MRPVEGIQESELSFLIFGKVLVKVSKFDLNFAILKLVIIFSFHSLFRLKQSLESFHIATSFWVVEEGPVCSLRFELDGVSFVEG